VKSNTSRKAAAPKPHPPVVSIDAGSHRQRVLARRDALVVEHIPLVRAIALSVAERLPPSFDLEDLIGEGHVALLHCATKYDPAAHPGVSFALYAKHRIRGAMLDSVRNRHYAENTRPNIEDVAEASVAPSVEIAIDRAQRTERIRRAVAILPAPQRKWIENRYFSPGADPRPGGKSETQALAIVELRRRLKDAA
jgi:RNA polymerase sigma factor (sigma-70 family)